MIGDATLSVSVDLQISVEADGWPDDTQLRALSARTVEAALAGQELTADNITAAVSHLAADLGNDLIGDVFASAEYRRAVAPVEVKHALLHAIGLAHH